MKILRALTNTFWILLQESQDFSNVLQFLVLPGTQNLIDLSVACPAPQQTHLFLLKYFEEHIFDYHGLGNKKMLFLESRQENMFDSRTYTVL